MTSGVSRAKQGVCKHHHPVNVSAPLYTPSKNWEGEVGGMLAYARLSCVFCGSIYFLVRLPELRKTKGGHPLRNL